MNRLCNLASHLDRAEDSVSKEIVIVEDDEDFVSLLRMEAESRGLKIRHYYDAESALKNWTKDAHGYLIDWDLPGLSGFELIQEIPTAQRERMVLMSSLVLPGVREKATSLGFRDCVDKPAAAGNFFDYVSLEEAN